MESPPLPGSRYRHAQADRKTGGKRQTDLLKPRSEYDTGRCPEQNFRYNSTLAQKPTANSRKPIGNASVYTNLLLYTQKHSSLTTAEAGVKRSCVPCGKVEVELYTISTPPLRRPAVSSRYSAFCMIGGLWGESESSSYACAFLQQQLEP